jgi:hypothetical protein
MKKVAELVVIRAVLDYNHPVFPYATAQTPPPIKNYFISFRHVAGTTHRNYKGE